MKALVVYESMWGNTREIAEAVASGLGRHVEVSTADVGSAPATISADIDLLVVGGPTHAYALSSPSSRREHAAEGAPASQLDRGLREWLDQVVLPSAPPVVAVFDTRLGLMRAVPTSAGRKAGKILTARGCRLASEPHSFYVHGHNGPLEPGERARAALWGERVALEFQLGDAVDQAV